MAWGRSLGVSLRDKIFGRSPNWSFHQNIFTRPKKIGNLPDIKFLIEKSFMVSKILFDIQGEEVMDLLI